MKEDKGKPAVEVLLSLKSRECADNADDSVQMDLIGKSAVQKQIAESGGQIIWRVANGLMTIFFIMAVGVQFNDPDPYLWVPLYGTAALLTVCVTVQPSITIKKWWRSIYWIHTVFCSGMFCYVFIELIIVAANPKSDGSLNPLMYEEGREMTGIMITVVWLFTCKQSPTIRSKTTLKRDLIVGIVIVVSSILPLSMWALCYSDAMNSSYYSFCGDYYMGEFSF